MVAVRTELLRYSTTRVPTVLALIQTTQTTTWTNIVVSKSGFKPRYHGRDILDLPEKKQRQVRKLFRARLPVDEEEEDEDGGGPVSERTAYRTRG